MGWRARFGPEELDEDTGESMTLWLRESYGAAGTQSTQRARPAELPMRALAVLDRPVDTVPEHPAPIPTVAHAPAPASALFAERRLERRAECAFEAAAAGQIDGSQTALGGADDISVSGVHLVMDKVAVVGPIDLIVAEVVVEARVVGHHQRDDGRHSWHVHVLDTDDAWLALVYGAL